MVAILEGTTVLDFTRVLSGPTTTRYLAELGADVIKVEAPPTGDITRSSPTRRDGRSGYFVNVNRGKRSVCIDLKDKRGLALVRRFAATVDVVVENFSPGTMDRLGLGWDQLSTDNPGLVMLSISGFGHHGPLAHLPGYDGAAQAYAGITSLNGEAGGDPVVLGAPVGDVLTGVNGAAGVLAALLWRANTGEGQHIETSVLGAYLQTHDTAIQTYSLTNGELVQRRSGRFHELACPYGIFTAGDGHIFIAAADNKHWQDLCRAIGDDELLAADHPWQERPTREAERNDVNAYLEAWLSEKGPRDAALALLQDHRVPCGPVLGVDEVAEHVDLHASGAMRFASDPLLGRMHVPGFPLQFSATDAGFDAEAPYLGEHNTDVLADVAGGPEALAGLIADGVVLAEDPPGRPTRQRTSARIATKGG
ncbi:MAG: CaiB/BaiF CoA transferase family protein [Acidimicrobiales bacterium]